jgi:hypothetical protein
MGRARWLWVALMTVAWTAEARAQLFVNPYGLAGIHAYGSGVRFKYRKRHLRVSGFFGNTYAVGGFGAGLYGPIAFYGPGFGSFSYFSPGPPLGVTYNTINVNYQAPPNIIVNNGADRQRLEDEVAGIDLDTTDPITLRPRKELREKELPKLVKKKPEPELMLPRKVARARPRPAVRPLPEKPEQDGADPLDLGKKAMAGREYGLAGHRFRQAALAAPRKALPHFLLAQALFALGKYRDALNAIHAGMDLKNNWPTEDFPPRALYKANAADFLEHLKRLEALVEKHPKDSVLLFVLGYELWFDGQRDKAVPLFRKAKQLAPNPEYCDRFLKARG